MIHLVCPNPALDRTLLVDSFERNIPLRPSEVREYPGGKSFNVAYALKQNGVEDYLIHTILGGPIGAYIQELNAQRRNSLALVESSQNTRTCNIYLDLQSRDTLLFYEKGLELDQDLLAAFTQQLESNLKEGDYLVFSGSLMKGMPNDYIQRFIEAFPQVHTIVDTSGAALRAAFEARPSLIKINNEELKELYPDLDEKDPDQILEILRKRVPHEQMIVTMGAKGSLAKIGQRYFRVQSPRVETANPIASGDFYLGLLVKGICQGQQPEEYLRAATAFARANCLNYFPEVDPQQFQDSYQQVDVTELFV